MAHITLLKAKSHEKTILAKYYVYCRM